MPPRFRKITIDEAILVTMTPSEETEAILQNLDKMMEHGGVLASVLHRAYLEVMVPAIRAAYLTGLPKAVDMQVVKTRADKVDALAHLSEDKLRSTIAGVVKSTPRQQQTAERFTMQRVFERLRAAVMRGDMEGHAAIQALYAQHEPAYHAALQRKLDGTPKESNKLSSGLFRSRATQVMALFSDPANMGMQIGPDSVTVGLGPLGQLNAIKTPSATEYVLNRGHTTSKYDVLWRQLEFGTGMYSEVERKNSKWTLPGGMWYYGARKEEALTLYGSQGVHALWGQHELPQHYGEMLRVVGRYLGEMLSGKLRL